MKNYRCYLRTVLLSVLAAFIIDAIINFDEYKQGWATSFRDDKGENYADYKKNVKLPVEIGKATGAIYNFILK